jgi:hypothetical protein
MSVLEGPSFGGVKNSEIDSFVHLFMGGFSLEDFHWLGWRLSCATGLATCSMMYGEVG